VAQATTAVAAVAVAAGPADGQASSVTSAAGLAGGGGGEQGIGATGVRPFSLTDVRLGPGPFRDAFEINRRTLDSLAQDRLLHTFRLNAGLPSSAEPLGGWEKPDCELRGHFAGGHYLSALALLYAATSDDAYKRKANTMVTELAKCQKALGSGYLSAFPEEFFDRLRAGVKVWAPYYTFHKIMAGHLHAFEHCGNAQALEVALGMAAWVRNWTKGLSDAHMDRVLLIEFGGMNDVLAELYAITGKEEYLDLARRFDHRALFDPLAARRDELQGLHVNTQIPKVIGAARRYELTGEHRYRDIAEFFWQQVTNERSYCTGGTSNGESWNTPPGVLAKELSATSSECCCSYNMLKLTRQLFTWTGDPRAADYYERTLFNNRLGTQNPEDGTLMYYVPLASGFWKLYGPPLGAFWCCTGTGAEEFAKAADSIYFHDDSSLFVNLFVASEVQWKEKGFRLRQETGFPEQEATEFTVTADRPVEITLRLRIPWWATRGGSVAVNGTPLAAFASPSSYLTLTRTWKTGDRVLLRLPMNVYVHPMPDDASLQAVMYGPLVLAGRLGTEGLTKEMMYGEVPWEVPGKGLPTPEIVASRAAPWVERVPGERLAFRTVGQSPSVSLVPLYRVFGERYAVYWNVRTRSLPT
jgi:DUF1680 family protein